MVLKIQPYDEELPQDPPQELQLNDDENEFQLKTLSVSSFISLLDNPQRLLPSSELQQFLPFFATHAEKRLVAIENQRQRSPNPRNLPINVVHAFAEIHGVDRLLHVARVEHVIAGIVSGIDEEFEVVVECVGGIFIKLHTTVGG
jgi:hypothetical protein